MVDGYVAGDADPTGACFAYQRHAGSGRNSGKMESGAGVARQVQSGRDGDRFGADRNPGQAEARGNLSIVGDTAVRERVILRLEADGVAESRGVLQGAAQHPGVAYRLLALRERDAAGAGQTSEFGELLATQPLGQGAEGIDLGKAKCAAVLDQALDETPFVEHRLGVGRAGERRDAAGDCRKKFALQGVEAAGKVNEPGTNHESFGVDCPVSHEPLRSLAMRGNPSVDDEEVGAAVAPIIGVDKAAIQDLDIIHGVCLVTSVAGQDTHHRHAHGDAEGDLRPDDGLRSVGNVRVDFHAAI